MIGWARLWPSTKREVNPHNHIRVRMIVLMRKVTENEKEKSIDPFSAAVERSRTLRNRCVDLNFIRDQLKELIIVIPLFPNRS